MVRTSDGSSIAAKYVQRLLRSWSTLVKARDGHRCAHCGSVRKLNAHHIVPKSAAPELMFEVSNGLTLCRTCHDSVHRSLRDTVA